MMLWNEASTLNKVLWSLREIADCFILGVDKKSNDGTQEIAQEWADEYFEFDWSNDFSRIRNIVLDRASTRWFFQVDGHEFLNEQSIKYIKELKVRDDVDVCFLNITLWGEEEPQLLFLAPRIFRTDRNIVYERKIHNTLSSKLGKDYYDSLKKIDDPGIVLDHIQPVIRHNMRANQRKAISIRGLTEQALAKNDSYDWYNLGVMKTYDSDEEGAIQAFENALRVCERDDARYQIKLFLAGLYKWKGERDKAKDILISAYLNDPRRCEHLVEIGALFEEENNLDKALWFYNLAASYTVPTCQMSLYLPYYSYFPYERMMKIYGKKGDLNNALKMGEKLREYKFFRYQEQLEFYFAKFGRMIV